MNVPISGLKCGLPFTFGLLWIGVPLLIHFLGHYAQGAWTGESDLASTLTLDDTELIASAIEKRSKVAGGSIDQGTTPKPKPSSNTGKTIKRNRKEGQGDRRSLDIDITID